MHLIFVVASWIFTYVQAHQIVQLKICSGCASIVLEQSCKKKHSIQGKGLIGLTHVESSHNSLKDKCAIPIQMTENQLDSFGDYFVKNVNYLLSACKVEYVYSSTKVHLGASRKICHGTSHTFLKLLRKYPHIPRVYCIKFWAP